MNLDDFQREKLSYAAMNDCGIKVQGYIYSSYIGNENSSIDSFLEKTKSFSIEALMMNLDLLGAEYPEDTISFFRWLYENLDFRSKEYIIKILFVKLVDPEMSRKVMRLFRKMKASQLILLVENTKIVQYPIFQ